MTTQEVKFYREREHQIAVRRSVDMVQQRENAEKEAKNLKSDYMLLQKKYNRLEAKEKELQKLCIDWNSNEDYFLFYEAVCKLVNSINLESNNTTQNINTVSI